MTLAGSYRYCDDVARREAGNFYPAFRLLPRPQRLSMGALYTFMRIADDLSDEPAHADVKRRALADWRSGMREAMQGRYAHPSHAALHDTVRTHGIPVEYLEALIDGVEMDLEPIEYRTFDDLRLYCYRVASVVGLCCIHIWGFRDERAKGLAEQAGLAFQLTNILRDLKEDAERGRVYLPTEELHRFGYDAVRLKRGVQDDAYRAMMRFEASRAQQLYDAAKPLAALLPPPGRAVYLMMSRTYRSLLNEIERRDYDVYRERVRVSRWKKLWLALQVLPVRFGCC